MGKEATPIRDWKAYQTMLECLRKDGNWRDLLLWAIGGYTAYRVSDYKDITWRGLLNASEVTVREKKTANRKGKRARVVHFGPNFRAIVEECARHMNPLSLPDHRCFRAQRRNDRHSITNAGINYILRQNAKKYAIPGIPEDVSTHSLRKCFCIHVWNVLGDTERGLITVSSMIGHKNTSTTMLYLGLDVVEHRRVYDII